MKKIVILTGNEQRHKYFRTLLSNSTYFNVIGSFCENDSASLKKRTLEKKESSLLEIQHVLSREQSEKDFFNDYIENTIDKSNAKIIPKGAINEPSVVSEIERLSPDILACYGSSIINSILIDKFESRFLNVHLGLSPYYRGSGTNIWPMINNDLGMVGATFMYIDKGIDTGEIIHQIRPEIFLGDNPHTIGNRLIKKMTITYANIISSFDNIKKELQPMSDGKIYKRKDFNENACKILYDRFREGIVENYINNKNNKNNLPYIVTNKGLSNESNNVSLYKKI